MIGTTSRAFLGLTVACARCHDHKFDPISQMDYYRMMAIFFPFIDYDYPLAPPAEAAAYAAKKSEIDAQDSGAHARGPAHRRSLHRSSLSEKAGDVSGGRADRGAHAGGTAHSGAEVAGGADAVDPQHRRAPDHAERRRSRGARETASARSRRCDRSFRRRCRSRPASAMAITGSRRTVRAMSRSRARPPIESRWISRAASCRSPASRTRRRLSTFPQWPSRERASWWSRDSCRC